MRPNATNFLRTSLSGAPLALARQLADGGSSAPPESLPLVTILRELTRAAEAATAGRRMKSSADRQSLRDDLARSLDSLGPELADALGAAADDLRHELNEVPGYLADTAGALIVLGHARDLLERLAEPRCTEAAWRDVVDAFQDNETVDICEMRIAHLRAMAELRGHEWSELARRLRAIVVDSPWDVAAAQGRSLESVDRDAPSGVELSDRLGLSEKVVGENPPEGAVVVWLAYVNAHLQDPFHVAISDGLTLYGSQLWDDDDVLVTGSFPRPAELDEPHRIYLDRRPAEAFVLLRVDLGSGAIHGALARARAIAEVLPGLVHPSSDWQLMDGEAGWIEYGGWFGQASFEDPAAKAVRSRTWGQSTDPMGTLLERIEPQLAEAIVRGGDKVEGLLDGFRWRSAVRRTPEVVQRVVLCIQAIERHLIPSRESEDKKDDRQKYEPEWGSLVVRYLQWLWALHTIQRYVSDAAYYGVHALPDRYSSGPVFTEFHTALVDEGTLGRDPIRVDREAAMRRSSELATNLDPGSMERRMLEEISGYAASAEASREWLGRAAARFETLLNRAIRVRNTITHGGSPIVPVVESVDAFVATLESMLLGAQQHAFSANDHPVVILQRWRVNALEHRRKLDSGADPVSVLMGS